jgi:hypothetical protein
LRRMVSFMQHHGVAGSLCIRLRLLDRPAHALGDERSEAADVAVDARGFERLQNPRITTCLANSGIFTYLTSHCFYAFHPIDDLVKYLCTHRKREGKLLDTKLGLVGLAQGRNSPCSSLPRSSLPRSLSQCAARPASRTITSRLLSLRDRTSCTGSRLDIAMEIDRW